MIVRLKQNLAESQIPKSLSAYRCYRVLAISADAYRLLNDDSDPVVYDHDLFDVIDDTEPEDWVTEYGEGGERYSRPGHLDKFVWERYHDGEPSAISAVNDYIASLGSCSWSCEKL